MIREREVLAVVSVGMRGDLCTGLAVRKEVFEMGGMPGIQTGELARQDGYCKYFEGPA